MKVIVAHPAQQHSYRLATALKNANMLEKYATTVYNKKGSLTALCAHLLRGKFRVKAESRHCDNLDDNDVIQFCELEGLIKLVALNTNFLKRHYYQIKYHTADCFARKVARYAIKHHVDAVITYDDSSPLLFEILEREAPHILRIMDMSSANLLYLKNIYEHDMELAPSFAERMRRERSICWDQDILDRAEREIKATQKFLVPSEFVSRSLAYSGVKSEQLLRCPYGVDIAQFSPKEYKDDLYIRNRAIRFIYVGGVKELKGISYLLEAFRDIPTNDAVLTVVGQYCPDDKDIQEYKDKVEFTGTVLHNEIPDLLRQADVFIFPPLGDSYALSVMEAAACGLPVIISENTGVIDEIQDGVNGFVVPVQSVTMLKSRIEYFINHPEKIESMGREARKMAEQNTWSKYYDYTAEIIKNVEGGCDWIEIKDYSNKPYRQRPLHFIYVGGVKELKGISYLLEAFKEIPVELADLTVVGNYCENDTDTRPYQGIVKFTGSILHSYVAEELKKADVFVFASLGEGLSLSTLEAAACGLPLIVTENSGVNDEMTDGVEGFVIPIQSKKAIQDKVYWFIEHPEMIHRMGEAAKLFAQKYTWEAYYKKVKEIFENEICSD